MTTQESAEAAAKNSSGIKVIFWVFGIVAILGAAAAAGVYVVGRHAVRTVQARISGDGAAGGGAFGRVAASLGTTEREERRPESFGCSLLSPEDAAAIAGTAVTRWESTRDGCTYFGVPEPTLNPEAIALKSLPGAGADPQASKMIDQFTAGMRSTVEQQDPGTRAGPGGERPLFGVENSAALSASMELSQPLGNSPAGGETVSGVGDQAFFVAMHKMFFVRKGKSYLLIQPQFVKDPRGVAISAAKRILASPDFGK